VTGATLFYLRCRWRNRLRGLVRRVKQPRYALGALVGVVYLCCILGLPFVRSLFPEPEDGGPEPLGGIRYRFVVPLVLVFGLLRTLRSAARDHGLPLPKAELLFLSAAPVTRRGLIGFWLATQQPVLLLSAALLGLIGAAAFGGRSPLGAGLVAFAAMNALLAVVVAARQVTAHLRARGAPEALVAAPFWLVVAGLLAVAAGAYRPRSGGEGVAVWLGALLEREPLATALGPFGAVAEGYFAPTVIEALPVAGALLGGAAALLALALARPAPFEEASHAAAEQLEALRSHGLAGLRRARRRAAARRRKGDRPSGPPPVPFRLAATGRPGAALAWKNLIGAGRIYRPRTALAALVLVAGVGTGVGLGWAGTIVPPVLAGCFAYGGLLTTMMLLQRAQDLRRDIPFFPVLKSYPLAARDVLAGEVAAPWAVIYGYQAVWITGALCVLSGFGDAAEWRPIGWDVRGPALAAALLFSAGFVYALCAIENAIALMWPGWSQIGPAQRKVGISQFGLNVVGLLVRWMFLMAGLVVPGAAGGLAFAAMALLVGAPPAWAAVPAAAVAAAALYAEVRLALRLVEPAYARFDVTSDWSPTA